MAEIIPFPLDRRAALVREITSNMEILHGAAANGYWREQIARIVADMRADGLDNNAIRTEVLNLQHAVQVELRSAYAARQ